MKTISLSLLKLANRLGLVRGVRAVRIHARHGNDWSVAVRLLGRWLLIRQTAPSPSLAGEPDNLRISYPARFEALSDLRCFLHTVGL